VIRYGDLIGIS